MAAILIGPMLSPLSAHQRKILDLRVRGSLTQEEIGSVIGVSLMQGIAAARIERWPR